MKSLTQRPFRKSMAGTRSIQRSDLAGLPAKACGERLPDTRFHFPRPLAGHDGFPYRFVPKALHQRGENLEVIQGEMRRRSDDEEQVDGLSVRGVKGDACPGNSESDQHAGKPGDPTVRHCHSMAEAGGLHFFPGNDRILKGGKVGDLPEDRRGADQLPDCGELVRACQLGNNRAGLKAVLYVHANTITVIVLKGPSYLSPPNAVNGPFLAVFGPFLPSNILRALDILNVCV